MGQALLSQKRVRKGVQTAQQHWSVVAATSPEGAGSPVFAMDQCRAPTAEGPSYNQQWRVSFSATAPPPGLALVLKTVCPIPRDPSEASSQEMGQDKGLVSNVVPTQVGRKA